MKTPVILLLVLTVWIVSCRRDPFAVNVSGIQVPLTVSRFEKDLFGANPSDLQDSVPLWKKKYGTFLWHFSSIVRLGNPDDPGYVDRLRTFATDHSNYLAYERTQAVFPTLDTFTFQFKEAFQHYRYYFPHKNIPRIITYVSGFNQSAITDDSVLAIGLDKYLGSNDDLYKQIGVYQYLLVNMHPKKIVSDGMSFWGETEFPFYDSVNNLLANMVYRGRLFYFTRAMLPDEPDTLIWGFTSKGLKFLASNEQSMWTDLVDNKLLFSTDRFTIDKFIQEGPFTKDFGRQSPGRAAVWIGYRIVLAYMKHHPAVTLAQLMNDKDYMRILNQSAYNP